MTIRKYIFFYAAVLLVSILISFTELYSYGYLLALIFIALKIKPVSYFSSLFGRLLLSFLMLFASIMTAGLLLWCLKQPFIPSVALFIFIPLGVYFNFLPGVSTKGINIKTEWKKDLIALSLALATPLVVLITYFGTPTSVAAYQFIATGWDNGWHINILQNVTNENGFLYNQGTGKKDTTSSERFHAYPQGWHLANSVLANGFGQKFFSSYKPVQTIKAYFVIYMFWFVIATYCFSRACVDIFYKANPVRKTKKYALIPLALVVFITQIVVIDGSAIHGFANYFAAITYIAVFISLTVDYYQSKNVHNKAVWLLLILCTVGAGLSWLLPLFGMAIALLVIILDKNNGVRGTLRRVVSHPSLLISSLIGGGVLFIQALIFLRFSDATNGQINEGSLSGSYPISQLLVFVFVIAALFAITRFKNISRPGVALLFAFSTLSFLVYAYQIHSSGVVSYYFGKTIGLQLIAISPFVAIAASKIMVDFQKLSRISPQVVVLGAITVSFSVLYGTSQSTIGFSELFQSNSSVTTATATRVVDFLQTSNPDESRIIILRGVSDHEDNHGYIESKLANKPYDCSYYLASSRNTNESIAALAKCSKNTDKKLTVITSQKTRSKIEKLNLENVSVVNVHEPKTK